jgi:hypothetical protein
MYIRYAPKRSGLSQKYQFTELVAIKHIVKVGLLALVPAALLLVQIGLKPVVLTPKIQGNAPKLPDASGKA